MDLLPVEEALRE